jgi:hypothetical protein
MLAGDGRGGRQVSKPLRLAVVGHTNTGKTSLLRTLARESDFGEVRDEAGTTRHVEGLSLLAGGEAVIELYDTPGMEDAIALLDFIDGLVAAGERIDGRERTERFLQQPAAQQRFEQEAKVLRQLLASDAGLYVVDAREPVLAKYRDELSLLAGCARPLLPVLNFVAAPDARVSEWRAALARLNFHALVSFDSVAPAIDGERELFVTLATLLHAHRSGLQALIDERAQAAAFRRAAGQREIAAMLIDLAARRELVGAEGEDDQAATAAAVGQLQAAVRAREQQCVDALLALYRFRPDDVLSAALPLSEGRWQDDLFSVDTLKKFSVRAPSRMAKGAALGVGIDLVAGGLTLGAAAALGAAAGGLWQLIDDYGGRMLARLRGGRELSVDETVLRVLGLRQLSLLAALERRGHAALTPIALAVIEQAQAELASDWRERELPAEISRARAHPEWARGEDEGGRGQAIEALCRSFGQDSSF